MTEVVFLWDHYLDLMNDVVTQLRHYQKLMTDVFFSCALTGCVDRGCTGCWSLTVSDDGDGTGDWAALETGSLPTTPPMKYCRGCTSHPI